MRSQLTLLLRAALRPLCAAALLLPFASANAQTKIIDLRPAIGTCTAYNNSALYNCDTSTLQLVDSISGHAYTLPSGTQSPLFSGLSTVGSANPAISWVSLPYSASVPLTGLAAVPTSNTTIKLRIVAQNYAGASTNYPYTSLLSMAAPAGYTAPTMLSIGQRGPGWTYGRLTDFPNSNVAYWMTPWEPVDQYPNQSYIYEDVYYTFTPDARLRIDMFTPYTQADGTLGYVWQESIQDGGWPLNTLGSDINTTTAPAAFLTPGTLILGKENSGSSSSYGTNNPSTVPVASGDGIAGIAVYSQAMTVLQMRTDANNDFASSSINPSNTAIAPCNTGLWMGLNQKTQGTVTTPCGSNTAPASPVPAPPSSVLPLDAYVPHLPQSFTVSNLGSSSFTLSWTAPPTHTAPSGYQVLLIDPNGVVSTHNVSGTSYNATGLTSGVDYYAYVVANYSGQTYADNVASQVANTGGLNPPTNLATSSVNNLGFTLTWTDPNNLNGATATYTVKVDGKTVCNSVAQLSCTVTGLTSGAKHKATVSESTGALVSDPSSTLTVTTTVAPISNLVINTLRWPTYAYVSFNDTNNWGSSYPNYQYTLSPYLGVSTYTSYSNSFSLSVTKSPTVFPDINYTLCITMTIGNTTASSTCNTFTTRVWLASSLTSVQSEPDALMVNWTDPNTYPDNAPVYTVTATPVGGGTPIVRTSQGTSLNLTGLNAGIAYQVVVTQTDDGETSPASNAITQTTGAYTPSGLTASSISTTGFTASWADPNAYGATEAHSYNVTLNGSAASCTLSGTSCVFTGLRPGTAYTVAVTDTANGVTSPAASISVSTPALQTPNTLTASNVGPTSFAMSWHDPNALGSATPTYTLSYFFTLAPPAIGTVQVTKTTSSPNYTFTGLSQGTTYSISLTETVDGVTTSAVSLPVTTTIAVGPVNNLAYDAYAAAPVASWSAPSGNSDAMTYNLSLADTTSGTQSNFTTSSTRYSLPAETVGHLYTLSVSATDPMLGITGASTSLTRKGANAPTPVGWTFCGNEGDTCTPAQTSWVLYGFPSQYNLRGQAGGSGVTCNNSTFGDPYNGKSKSCFTASDDINNWAFDFCSNEGSTCNVTDSNGEIVFFGATVNNVYQYVARYFPAGTTSFSCSTGTFGSDPAKKHAKTCVVMQYF